MNKYFKLMCSIIAVIVAVQCFANAPKKENTFKNTVLNQIKQSIAERIVTQMYTKVTGVPVALYTKKVLLDHHNANVKSNKTRYAMKRNALPHHLHERKLTYTWLNSQATKDPDAKKVIAAIHKAIEAKQLQVVSIKTLKPLTSHRWTAILKADKQNYDISFHAVFRNGKKPRVEYSGLDQIQFGDEQNSKVLSFKQVDISKLQQLKNEYHAANGLKKDEFETDDEYKARVLAGRIKAYKNFRATGIAEKVFAINCNIENSLSLKFNPNKKTLNCFMLFNVLAQFTSKYKYISSSSASEYHIIDFVGVLKKYPLPGTTAFRCTVPEARRIKKGLGNTWDYNKLKLWMKFNLTDMSFHPIKIFILANKAN